MVRLEPGTAGKKAPALPLSYDGPSILGFFNLPSDKTNLHKILSFHFKPDNIYKKMITRVVMKMTRCKNICSAEISRNTKKKHFHREEVERME